MARSGVSAHAAALLVAVFFAACSCVLSPLGRTYGPAESGAVLVVACFGAVLAAPELLAIGAVFGPRPYWFRIPLALAAGLLLCVCWLVGGLAASSDRIGSVRPSEWRLCGIGLLCLPTVFLAYQAPLWLMRLLFQWRFVAVAVVPSARPESSSPTSSSVTIRGMLIAMACVGVSLAAARIAAQLAVRYESLELAAFWTTLGIVCAACGGLALVSSLPLLVLALRTRSVLHAVAGIVIYVALWIAMLLLLDKFLRWNVFGRQDTLFACAVVMAFATAQAVPLLIARRLGLRLHWGATPP